VWGTAVSETGVLALGKEASEQVSAWPSGMCLEE
jgi:hypothetical protein